MTTLLSHLLAFLAGAAMVAAWWWWIGHRAKARALAQQVAADAKKL